MNLPAHLQAYLIDLRSDHRFQAIMKAIPRTKLKPFPKSGEPEKAMRDLIFDSGKLAAESFIMLEVLGYDPNDRPTD